jgi:hypothetical protein
VLAKWWKLLGLNTEEKLIHIVLEVRMQVLLEMSTSKKAVRGGMMQTQTPI